MVRFRGKTKDNGKWVYGGFMQTPESPFIIDYSVIVKNAEDGYPTVYDVVEVIPSTIAQFTTVKDENDDEIYGSFPINGIMTEGGDIVEAPAMHKGAICGVYWDMNCWCIKKSNGTTTGLTNYGGKSAPKIIGNQTDNKGLLNQLYLK